MNRKTALPYALLLCISAAISLVSASQFVGWPLMATEMDFLIMPTVLAQKDAYAGTPYLALAENLRAMSILPSVVSLVDWIGVPADRQAVYFGILQAFFVCAGVASVFIALGGRRYPWLVLAGFLIFLASGKHYFYYFKLVSSTFVSGLVLLALAAAIGRKYWWAAVFTALIGAVHPTYFVLTIAGIVVAHWASAQQPLTFDRRDLYPLRPFIWVAVPFIIVWLFNSRAILQPSVDKDLWFAFMQARSDLAFPMRQGHYAVMSMLTPLVIASLVFWQERRRRGEQRYAALAALAALGVLAVIVAILGSEVLRSPTLTRLALSHRLQFTLDILVFVAIVWIVLRRYVDSGLVAWIAMLWFGVYQNFSAAIPVLGLSDRATFYLAVLALQLTEDAAQNANPLMMFKVAGAWAFALADIALFFNPTTRIIWILAGATIELSLRRRWLQVAQWAQMMRPIAVAAIVVAAAGLGLRGVEWRAAGADLRAFATHRVLEVERWRIRRAYHDFFRFITETVPPGEQIMAVPIFQTQSFTTAPFRAMYLDWAEMNYVLYLGSHLDATVKRLATYEIDPRAQAGGCNLITMFLASENASNYRCQRMEFQARTMHDARAWRNHVDSIEALAPKTKWAMIHERFLCRSERPVVKWSGLALMRLSDVVRQPDCGAR
jgi:hypothetical protein